MHSGIVESFFLIFSGAAIEMRISSNRRAVLTGVKMLIKSFI